MNYKNNALKSPILRATLVPYDSTFASGIHANNKLELDNLWLPQNEVIRRRVIDAAANLVVEHFLAGPTHKQALIPVPTGANRLGELVAQNLGVRYIEAEKDKDTKQFSLSAAAQKQLDRVEKVILFEDVPNGLNSLRRMTELSGIDQKLIGALGCFDRGDRRNREPLRVPLHSIVEEYLPPQLPADSPLWGNAAQKTTASM